MCVYPVLPDAMRAAFKTRIPCSFPPMADLTAEIAAEVVAACRAGADEIGASLSRALDSPLMGITIGAAVTYDAAQPPEGFDGPGLAIVLQFGEVGAAAFLPESSGLLPEWYANPDPTGRSKLSTLAQELGMLLVPASLMVDEFHAVRITDLSETLAKADRAADAAMVPLGLKSDARQGQLSLIWPLAKPGELLVQPTEPAAESKPADTVHRTDTLAQPEDFDISQLSPYTQSLFKIKVPVSVNLASHKQSVQEIIEMVPGSIIKFDKSCDELLELVVGDQTIAEGEVVKVGDKFGLRVQHMIRPQERFIAIKTTMAS
jgi:flagellar motor switch protein FliN/FliY